MHSFLTFKTKTTDCSIMKFLPYMYVFYAESEFAGHYLVISVIWKKNNTFCLNIQYVKKLKLHNDVGT